MIVDPQHFTLMWSRQARDIIALHRGYVRITGDIGVGAALSQILYWFDVDTTGKPRTRVIRDGEFWLAKSAEALAEELGLLDEAGQPRAKVARRYIHSLRALGLIEVELRRFDGAPTTHIKPVWEAIAERIARFAQMGISGSVNSESGNSICPNGNPDFPTAGKSITKTTTEITTRIVGDPRGSGVGADAPASSTAAPLAAIPKTKSVNGAPPAAFVVAEGGTGASAAPPPSLVVAAPDDAELPDDRPAPHGDLFDAICDACGFNPDMLDGSRVVSIRKLAKECRDLGFSLDLVRHADETWYTVKFSHKSRDEVTPPTVKQLREWIGDCSARIAKAQRQRAETATSTSTKGGKRWLTN